MTPTNERLEVEDDEQREARLSHLLHRANSTASHSSPFAPLGPSQFDFGVRETHPVEPPTHLLERLHQLLPQMEAANAELVHRAQVDPESVDIEHLDNAEDGQYIEMNLGLGVYDMHRPTSEGVESNESNARSISDASGSSDDDTSDSDTSGSETGNPATNHVRRPTLPLPKRARPNIVVLEDAHTASP
ncbi:hypothetical protein EW145_g961 [Phellinidium pouzarii]|uniref:Uncharacterized protein n=1 Tax=Phellinidium pouzarii TaxID=167371 RepID=A0A4S4LGH2_9AGAM|nr:hypothetical protein EW145_g961 [Phellinidium pouzarii]